MFIEYISEMIVNLILLTGYFGVFVLMAMESMIFPVPSEAVMPFVGFLVADGKFLFLPALIASSLGSIVGSLISYYLGKYLGRSILERYGKYLLLNRHHLELTERFFSKKGQRAIFIGRFIPVIRHLISIPAGIAKMNLNKFILCTFLGATIWNSVLLFLGYKLRENWALINDYSKELDILVIILLIIGIVYLVSKPIRKRYKQKTS